MDWNSLPTYLMLILVAGFFAWKVMRFGIKKDTLLELLERGAVIVDVRSRAEFQSGSSEGSINIPLNEIEKSADQLDPKKPVIVCCASGARSGVAASGARSGVAASALRRKGFIEVVNAGSWTNTVTNRK